MVPLLATTVAALLAGAATLAPPPASIVTSTGRYPLAQSSYCWSNGKSPALCADYIPPRCGDGRTPTIRVRRGETVRFELRFPPQAVGLTFVSPGSSRTLALPATRQPAWRAAHSGAIALFARARGGNDTSYTACIVFRR